MSRPKKKKQVVVPATEMELAFNEAVDARVALLRANADVEVATAVLQAAETNLQAVSAEQKAEEAMERTFTSTHGAALDALEQWEMDEKKLSIARRRQKSQRPTPAREWPVKQEYLVRRVEISSSLTMNLVYLNDSCKADLALHYQE